MWTFQACNIFKLRLIASAWVVRESEKTKRIVAGKNSIDSPPSFGSLMPLRDILRKVDV